MAKQRTPHHGKFQARDARGKFDLDGDMNRICVCGHPLGNHAASNPTRKRPCLTCEPSCQNFRLRRKKGT